MKKIKLISLVLVLSIIFGALTGCSLLNSEAEPKEFSKAGMTVTLTDDFTEKELVSQTAYYESIKAIVTVLKEELTALEEVGITADTSLEDYAQVVIDGNLLEGTAVKNESGLTYFTYEKEVSGKEYTYYATVYKSSDAFWLIQFASETKNFETMKKDFIEWAKSVKFS